MRSVRPGPASVQGVPMVDITIRRSRSDALPENADYRDDGCDVSPSCLNCPLPMCRYEVHGGVSTIDRIERYRRIRELHAAGLSAAAIAEQVGCSRRTVSRALKEVQS